MLSTLNLKQVIEKFKTLQSEVQPLWGSMTAQRMIEHLTDTLCIAAGKNKQKLVIPKEKLGSMLRFLESDKEMMKNVDVAFAPKDAKLRNTTIADAVKEYENAYLAFELYYKENPSAKELHPYYGALNLQQWKRLHQKHLRHHLKQFNLIS